ncbi:Clp protease N-terminal domain-containing protein [Micromonospora endolithica]|uniref:Clp R domain-containing protein n=1 Tax=Micromonospora endolithica TaxID=230091 RepID=A0A3A9ZPS4_9ACTN|nr:Clp protease N-terminal domain-containing protein [Micromonospora endolithica]RKN50250.1 hypothetical protein D7223_00020 [Micromonospora endolithica]TWJ21109.1 ClpA/ClpB-like protein [Micromonospora endolithica]
MFEQFSAGSQALLSTALIEVGRRGDRRVSTEHLLLGLLHDTGSPATRALGITLESARAALEALDSEALAALQLNVTGVHRTPLPPASSHAPWTSAARAALKRTAAIARTGRSHSLEPQHLLLALLETPRPDPVAELLDRLGVDRAAVRAALSAGPAAAA